MIQTNIINHLYILKKIHLQSERIVYLGFLKAALNFAFSFLRMIILGG